MAKILGLRSAGSRAPGRVFGTCFVVYANRYGYTFGYNSLRRFVAGAYPAHRFYRLRAREFGLAVSRWPKLTDAQRAEYDYAGLLPLASPMERYISDYTFLAMDPFTCTAPVWQGAVYAEAKSDYMKVWWECPLVAYETPPHRQQMWIFKANNPTGEYLSPKLVQRHMFNPTYTAYTATQIFDKDYWYTVGNKSAYKIVITAGQNMREESAVLEDIDNPTNDPGETWEDKIMCGGIAPPPQPPPPP